MIQIWNEKLCYMYLVCASVTYAYLRLLGEKPGSDIFGKQHICTKNMIFAGYNIPLI